MKKETKRGKENISKVPVFKERNQGIICDWILGNPNEIKDEYHKSFKYYSVDGSLAFIRKYIFDNLEREAKYILGKNNHPTDLDDLRWEDEYEMDSVSVSAMQVLFLIHDLSPLLNGCNDCKRIISENKIKFWKQVMLTGKKPDLAQETFIYTMLLTSAIINMGINPGQLVEDILKLNRKVKFMKPDHDTQEKHRMRLKSNRDKRSKEAEAKREKWFKMAIELKEKHPEFKMRSVALNICNKLDLPKNSLQAIHKFLLKRFH